MSGVGSAGFTVALGFGAEGSRTAQLAIRLAKLVDGAVVSMMGCSAADDVPSLKDTCVDELGISGLVTPAFEGS